MTSRATCPLVAPNTNLYLSYYRALQCRIPSLRARRVGDVPLRMRSRSWQGELVAQPPPHWSLGFYKGGARHWRFDTRLGYRARPWRSLNPVSGMATISHGNLQLARGSFPEPSVVCEGAAWRYF